jgi:ribosomal protein L37AE/L43A
LIGISDGDSVGIWKCPFCAYTWDREGATAARARENIKRADALRAS